MKTACSHLFLLSLTHFLLLFCPVSAPPNSVGSKPSIKENQASSPKASITEFFVGNNHMHQHHYNGGEVARLLYDTLGFYPMGFLKNGKGPPYQFDSSDELTAVWREIAALPDRMETTINSTVPRSTFCCPTLVTTLAPATSQSTTNPKHQNGWWLGVGICTESFSDRH